jgi:hypothetical protein
MGTTYVEVPREDIINILVEAGFTRLDLDCKELVYEKAHEENPVVRVRVYTSLSAWSEYKTARPRGRDSIKVCTVVQGHKKTYGIGKFPRIHRTGSVEKVLARMQAKMRAAYDRGTEWLREQKIKDVMLA